MHTHIFCMWNYGNNYFYWFLLVLLHYSVERCGGKKKIKSLQASSEDFNGHILFLMQNVRLKRSSLPHPRILQSSRNATRCWNTLSVVSVFNVSILNKLTLLIFFFEESIFDQEEDWVGNMSAKNEKLNENEVSCLRRAFKPQQIDSFFLSLLLHALWKGIIFSHFSWTFNLAPYEFTQ